MIHVIPGSDPGSQAGEIPDQVRDDEGGPLISASLSTVFGGPAFLGFGRNRSGTRAWALAR